MAAPSRLSQQDCITVLPRELLRCIGERLPWGRDVANFRLTGRLWRATVPLVNFSPLLMLPFDPESPDAAVTFYRPTDGEIISMNLPALHGKVVSGSSHGWLVLVDVSGSVTLLNPFTRATVDLPPADKHVVDASFKRYAWMDADGSRWLVRSSDGRQQRPVRLDDVRDDGPAQEDQDHKLEISDIHNGTSELLCYHNKTGSNVWPALCWIQPKPNP